MTSGKSGKNIMGGFGSGRSSSYSGKNKTEDSLPLDIRKLQRTNCLIPGRSLRWEWSVNDKTVSSIRLKVEADHVILAYRQMPQGEREWLDVEQSLYMDHTSCTYGGTRHWWLCPFCGRRVAVLYNNDKHYACRNCHRLTYTSQVENTYDRALRQAQKIRKLLGGTVNMMESFPAKPKGMRWKTYWRLHAEHDALDKVTLVGLARWVGKLEKRRE